MEKQVLCLLPREGTFFYREKLQGWKGNTNLHCNVQFEAHMPPVIEIDILYLSPRDRVLHKCKVY